MLTGPLPIWDIDRRRADVGAVSAWVGAQLEELVGRPVALADPRLDGEKAMWAAEQLTRRSLGMRGPLHALIRDVLPEHAPETLAVQTWAHFRILVPDSAPDAVPPHTDHGFGHGLHERNLWIALTDAEGPAALHLTDLRASLKWITGPGRPHGVLEDAPPPTPVPAKRGDVLLFTPLHIHASHPPARGARVSIDVRLVPRSACQPDYTFCPLAVA